jgi:hypothetical protein
MVASAADEELDVDEPPLLLLIATTATTPKTSAAIETATNMRPTTDLARNDSLFSTVDPDEVSDMMFAFRCVTSGYEIVPSRIQFFRDEKQQILH